mmetsp:Transcript_10420/g.15848  ORF Transcript_10420/g.15848 Transcript_10420/m.15848 type:complete len:1219 (+) Transcript_10420:174-3830(+)|eukprot:CAMPEP_0185036852 /NCGR_PEP_ID=MMETSP1103-20130426/30442_1 /TAXON_ID=36769 /ORGANISM="Paraphysomonas bandaiensis, Strain Caron Lab Isolate" /LENGTH=1218 /DNA_ID=CAMNT_0027574573 /DNA_START=96 /DNA_END=3752 /DNA_ORIENTATION=-
MATVSEFQSLLGTNSADVDAAAQAIEALKNSPRTEYSKLRNEREQATFNLMMRMDPAALSAIRNEFYTRGDSIARTEFIYIMSKHLLELDGEGLTQNSQEQRDFVSDMQELFKEVDVNGDGLMEWEEFTKFTVEKASLLNQQFVMATIPEYQDSTWTLDLGIRQFRRNNVSAMLPLPTLGSFAVLEDHRKAIDVYHLYNGRHVTTIETESVPLAIDFVRDSSQVVAACSDLQIVSYYQVANKRFQVNSSWMAPETQMSLAWMSSNELLYSGSINGNIYSWNMSDKSLAATMPGHSDICMKLLALDQLDNLMSASLDTTIGVWDTYTNTVIHKLRGHRKGVFDMSYNTDYRLLFSCGFDHDTFVWSPFVNSLVYKLKGHHASLVGCQSIENSPEVITADEDGVFKLWDVRTFQCVQTFFNNSSSDNEPAEHLSCFFHQHIPSSALMNNEGGEARIYAGSRRIHSFDQKKVVHEKTTDFTNVIWLSLNSDSLTVITASNHNLIIWDLLLGSKMLVHNNICGEEISACCLDNRKRKIIIGDVQGNISVYNPLNGTYMKSCPNDVHSVVISLCYLNDSRRFLAGYVNGVLRLYDETKLDDCHTLRTFDIYNMHPELVFMGTCNTDRSVITTGAFGQPLKIWDFDTGKLDMELEVCDERETIVAMVVLDPYPLIATSDSRGNVIIWGCRGCKWKGDKITGFLNLNPVDAEMEPLGKPDANGDPPQRVFPYSSGGDDASRTSDNDSVGLEHSTIDVDHSLESMQDKIDQEARESEKKWGAVSAATAISWDADTRMFYTGDDLGYLRKWNLNHVIEELGGMSMVHGAKSVRTKLASRKVNRTHSCAMMPITGNSIPFMLGKKGQIAFMGVKFCWAVQGHQESIIYCSATPKGILTSSTDLLVKMWTFDGLLVGVLLHSAPMGVRSPNWDLSIDIAAIREREERELDAILAEIVELAKQENASQDVGNILNSTDEAKFSRSSLRKRIEMSSRILGLDFSGETYPDDPVAEESPVHLEEEDSHASSASKSTKNAIDESKNIHRQPGLKVKKKSLSVAQLRRKEHNMQKMAEKYIEKGIKLPVLSSAPKEPGQSRQHSQDNSFLSKGTPPLTPDKSNKFMIRDRHSSIVSPNVNNISVSEEQNEKIDKKCSKFKTFDLLEKSLRRGADEPVSAEEKALRRQQKLDNARDAEARRKRDAQLRAQAKALREVKLSEVRETTDDSESVEKK